MSTLYPAMVNSPVTELAAAIDAVATTITVLNGAALPDAPNIATIGQGENAETVMYAAKSGNTLSSVTRGFQGTARTWPISSKIARNFTAYDYDTIRQKLDEGQTIPAPISRGVNVIQSDQASGATFNVLGCTLCNILGRDGGCESLAPFTTQGPVTIDTTIKHDGNSSISVTSSVSSSYAYKDFNYTLDTAKHYLLAGWIYIQSASGGQIGFRMNDVGSLNTTRYGVYANNSTVGSWQFVYVKIPTANTFVGAGFRLLIGSYAATTVANLDSIRLYEVSASDYAAIGTTITGEAIDRRWPYVDSVQHTRGLSVLMPGKNLYIEDITATSGTGSSYVRKDARTVEVTSGAGMFNYALARRIKVQPFTNYVVSGFTENLSGVDAPVISVRRGSDNGVVGINNATGIGNIFAAFNTSAETEIIIFLYGSRETAAIQTKRYTNVQVELGSTPSNYEPYRPSYAHADTALASNVDRSIADSYDSATGQVFRRWITGVKVDGSRTWILGSAFTGYRRVHVSNFAPAGSSSAPQNMVTFDGKVLRMFTDANVLDTFYLQVSSGTLHVVVSNSESGWNDAVVPTSNAIKAFMNGWKANGNNGTVYNSWVSILTGAAPATNTEAYVAANKAPGWDAYATLDYVRSKPITETLTGYRGGLALVKGGNTVELLEGVIVRERAYPKLDGDGWFIMSADSSEFWGASRVKYSTRKFLSVYKGTELDSNWWAVPGPPTYITASVRSYSAADIAANEWYVDYIVMDKHSYTANAVDATLVYRSTLGGAVAQATQDIARLTAQMGVHEWKLLLDEAYAANIRRDFDAHAGAGGSAHALATTGAAGFMSAADKAAVDAIADQMRTISMGGMV